MSRSARLLAACWRALRSRLVPPRWSGVSVGVLALSPLLVEASALADEGRPPLYLGAQPERAGPLVVESETLEVTCNGQSRCLMCRGRSHLAVRNDTDFDERVRLEVFETATGVELGSRQLPVAGPVDGAGNRRLAAAVVFPAHGRTELTVEHAAGFRWCGGPEAGDVVSPVLVSRHPVASSYPGSPTPVEIILQGSHPRRWRRIEREVAVLRYPERWALQPTSTLQVRALGAGRMEGRLVSNAPTSASRAWQARAVLALREQRWFVGGPLAGVLYRVDGASADWDDLALRLGYEWGIGAEWIAGVSGEYSAGGEELLVPSLDYALVPALGNCGPAVSAGFGAPVRLTRERAVGARLQLDATMPGRGALAWGWFLYGESLIEFASASSDWRGGVALQASL